MAAKSIKNFLHVQKYGFSKELRSFFYLFCNLCPALNEYMDNLYMPAVCHAIKDC